MIYQVIEPKRVDEIVYEVYGDVVYLEDILKINQHLKDKIVLDVGDMVNLIEITPKIKEVQTLW